MAQRILIVDDSRVMREMISRTITMSELSVAAIEQAGNGAEALEKLRAQSFDLVLLDLNMPVMDGEQFLAAVRADRALKDLPIIVASTESSDTRIRRLRLMGAEFIHKPFRPEELVAVVNRIATTSR